MSRASCRRQRQVVASSRAAWVAAAVAAVVAAAAPASGSTIDVLNERVLPGLFGNGTAAVTPLSCGDGAVQCDALGNVVAVDLARSSLNGTLPPQLGELRELEVLQLSHNELQGTLPAEVFGLSALRTLSMRHNGLTGTFPERFSQLRNLTAFDVANNRLSGTLPYALIAEASQLEILSVYGNAFSGTIGTELGTMHNLRTLSLWSMELTGTVPSELGRLTNLQIFYLMGNQLSGTLPIELGAALHNALNVQVHGNLFCGPLPALRTRGGCTLDQGANDLNCFTDCSSLRGGCEQSAPCDTACTCPYDWRTPPPAAAGRTVIAYDGATIDVGDGQPPEALDVALSPTRGAAPRIAVRGEPSALIATTARFRVPRATQFEIDTTLVALQLEVARDDDGAPSVRFADVQVTFVDDSAGDGDSCGAQVLDAVPVTYERTQQRSRATVEVRTARRVAAAPCEPPSAPSAVGAAIGGAVGVALLLCVCAAAAGAALVLRRRRRRADADANTPTPNGGGDSGRDATVTGEYASARTLLARKSSPAATALAAMDDSDTSLPRAAAAADTYTTVPVIDGDDDGSTTYAQPPAVYETSTLGTVEYDDAAAIAVREGSDATGEYERNELGVDDSGGGNDAV